MFVGVRSKNIFEALTQKVKEWVIAVRLERQYTKEEIIKMYLNVYDFGYNGDGIKSAANIYFGKEPIDLNIEESAVLVGMLKNLTVQSIKKTRIGAVKTKCCFWANEKKWTSKRERI